MKKRTCCLAAVILFLFLFAYPVLAAEAQGSPADTYYEDQLEASGAKEVKDSLPEETKKLLKELGVDDFDYKKLMEVSPSSFFSMFLDLLRGKMYSPLKAGGMVLGVVLLCSLLKSMRHGLEDTGNSAVFSYISALFAGAVLMLPITGCLTRLLSTITASSHFMLAFVPVFTALAAASGNPVSAYALHGLLVGLAEVIANFASHFLAPLTGIFLAFSVVGSMNSTLQLQSLTATLKKTVTLVLSFVSTVFFALLSIRGNITAAADSVTMRGAKFAISSFIPVVGSAISDGLASIQGCAGLIKNAVGVFGIFAIILVFLPAIAELCVWMLTTQVCTICSDLFDQSELSGMLRGIQNALTLLFVIVLLIAVLMVISTGILLKMRNG